MMVKHFSRDLPKTLGYIGVMMEKKMEATIVYWGYIGNNGKETGSYHSILGLFWGDISYYTLCVRFRCDAICFEGLASAQPSLNSFVHQAMQTV